MNALSREIQAEIARDGPISLARFMEIALYAPGLGYYERQREIGQRGDFFTSVSVGAVFGQLLAFQFVQWLDTDCPLDTVQLVEAGAHQGALAADVLTWIQRWRPEIFARLDYWLIESSPTHRAWQAGKLQPWLSKIKWARDIAELGASRINGVIFSNEFLDAMPIHQLAWTGTQWQERCVNYRNDQFIWQLAAPPAALLTHLPKIPPELADVLPTGFIIEISSAAVAWWSEAAKTLRRGKLMTLDYGLTGAEQIRPERPGGTLRAISQHHLTTDPLANPGECDLTAHVDFSAIEEAGAAAGLKTRALMLQSQFFTKVLEQISKTPNHFDEWTSARVKQFRTLTHPEHLGHRFRVLIQERPS